MRVVFLIRSLGTGGSERQLGLLAPGLSRRGHEILVLTYYEGGRLWEELKDQGVQVRAIGKRSRWDLIGPFARMVREVRGFRAQVLHGYLVTSNLLVSLAGPLLPGVKRVWGVRATRMDLQAYDWVARLTYGLAVRAWAMADLVIVNSHAGMTQATQEGCPASKLRVVPNGFRVEGGRPEDRHILGQQACWPDPGGGRAAGAVRREDERFGCCPASSARQTRSGDAVRAGSASRNKPSAGCRRGRRYRGRPSWASRPLPSRHRRQQIGQPGSAFGEGS